MRTNICGTACGRRKTRAGRVSRYEFVFLFIVERFLVFVVCVYPLGKSDQLIVHFLLRFAELL